MARRLSREVLEGILAISADAIVSVDADQRIVLFNEAAERMFGHAAADVIGQPLDLLLPQGLGAAHRGHVSAFGDAEASARHMADRATVHGRRASGEVFPAEISISRLPGDDGILFTAVVRDVSAQKAAEWRESFLAEVSGVLASSLDYEATLDMVAHVAVPELADWCMCEVVAEDGAVQTVVVRAADPDQEAVLREMLRRYPHDPRDPDRPTGSVTHTGEPVRLVLDGAAAFGEAAADDDEAELLRQLGPHTLLVVPLVARGRILGVMAFGAAGTEPRYLDEERDVAVEVGRRAGLAVDNAALYRAAQRATRARDEVLGIVAHDLRNLLHGIVMGGNMLIRRLEDLEDPSFRKPADAIMRSADRMSRLIADLLDVARIESRRLSVSLEPQEAPRLVQSAVEMLEPVAAGKGIHLVPDSRDVPRVMADRDRVVQVLANLVGNAIKFAPPGSEVEIRAEAAGDTVRFAVADHGPGIPPEDVVHLFDPYWQARQNRGHGSGLGLAIAKGIVEAHGGSLWVESEHGAGSTFYFTLPPAPRPRQPTA